MSFFGNETPPAAGEAITIREGKLRVPDRPIVPFIEGDGVGPEIWQATRRVLDAAVQKAYAGQRQIQWFEVYAGEKAQRRFGQWLPEDTLRALREFVVSIKGPLTTPVGGGIRSLNVTLRQELDLYACIRPVRWVPGVPSPVRHPENVDMVIFRENTEDVYAGLEWPAGSPEAARLREFLQDRLGIRLRPDAGLGLKPVSEFGSKRLVRKAIQYALQHGRRSVTLVHKGNIMKYTEGAFREWGYQVAREEFGDVTVSEAEAAERFGGPVPPGIVVIKDRIADNMFQQALLRPEEYDVLATPNLNGDYLSDALAAQVGGLGMAPGANVSDYVAVFEATHGTAPRHAGQNRINPGSLILSGVMMLDYLGWSEAARQVEKALQAVIQQGTVTYDLARDMPGAQETSTSGFAEAIVAAL
ncbi:MAG: isocitrate dehydrogenase (NADP(+)) [Firmicutes bacterium]|nr:isocitrate dehydrogenase (NADP(+)) [Bacillota bacterium]